MKEEFKPEEMIKSRDELMKDILEYSRKLENEKKPKGISLDKRPEMIEYKTEHKEAKEEGKNIELTEEEKKAKFALDFLIDTCGEEKIKNRVEIFDELLTKFPKFIKEAEAKINQGILMSKNDENKDSGSKNFEVTELGERLMFFKNII